MIGTQLKQSSMTFLIKLKLPRIKGNCQNEKNDAFEKYLEKFNSFSPDIRVHFEPLTKTNICDAPSYFVLYIYVSHTFPDIMNIGKIKTTALY